MAEASPPAHRSIKQLKEALRARGVSTAGMTERCELEAALAAAAPAAAASARATPPIEMPADGIATPEARAAFRASLGEQLRSGGFTPAEIDSFFTAPNVASVAGTASAGLALDGGLQGLLGLLAGAAAAGVAGGVEAEAAAAYAAAPPPFAAGFCGGCDHLQCLAAAGSELRACASCGEARYCSVACQRAAWRPLRAAQALPSAWFGTLRSLGEAPPEPQQIMVEGHKAFCSALRAAPRPLRLISRGVEFSVVGPWVAVDPEASRLRPQFERKLASSLSCCSAYVGRTVPHASDAAAVDAILASIKATRLVLVVVPCEVPPEDAARGSAAGPMALLFDVDLGSAGAGGGLSPRLTGAALIKAAADAIAFRFFEEDRLAPGVRYEAGGMGRVGMALPPEYARRVGYPVDAAGCVTSLQRQAVPACACGFGSRFSCGALPHSHPSLLCSPTRSHAHTSRTRVWQRGTGLQRTTFRASWAATAAAWR